VSTSGSVARVSAGIGAPIAVLRPAQNHAVGTVEGDAERLLKQLGLRYAAIVHGVVGACCGLVGLLSVEPAMRWRSAALAGLVLGWGWFYSRRLLRGPAAWLVVVDVAVVVCVCLNIGATERPAVLAAGAGWVISWASFVCVTYQLHTTPLLGFTATAVIDLAIAVGVWQASSEYWRAWVVNLLWLLISAGLSRWLWVLVRRGGELADQAADVTSKVRREREVARAVRADEQRAVRMLHDTASTTLLMVGAGCVRPTDYWLPEQAARDLAALSRVPEMVPTTERDLRRALEDVISESALTVRLEGPEQLSLPGDVATTLAGAVREALTNALRHSGGLTATCRVIRLANGVQIEVVDDGVGFEGDSSVSSRRGITQSILDPVQAVGGAATVASRRGHGTVVCLSWQHDARRDVHDDDATVWQADLAVATDIGLQRQLRLATLIIASAVLFFLAPATFFANLAAYQSISGQLVAFGILSLVLVVGWVAFWRDRGWGRWRWPAIGVLAVAGVLSAAGIEPTAHALASYWFVGTAPWLVLVVLGERLRQVIAILLAHHLVAIARMLILPTDGLTAGHLAGMITSAGYALAIAVATWTLASLSRQAARRRREAEEVRIADQLAAQTHESRRQRYVELSAMAGPLLAGLADRTLDPQNEAVRRRCAIGAARMRRIFAESDEVPDPLLHELRACADLADRRGVIVTLATSGSWPELPKQVRRELTEVPLMLLATARSRARITVTGANSSLSVSVVADSPDFDVPLPRPHNVLLSVVRSEEVLWAEAQWGSESSR
jgi:hypothetical protein